MDTTKVIKLCEFVESKSSQTTMIGTNETTINIQADSLARHARTMIMMFQATNDPKYLRQARIDVLQAKSLLRSGFVRPLGVLLKQSA